jgi:hypothetical protein
MASQARSKEPATAYIRRAVLPVARTHRSRSRTTMASIMNAGFSWPEAIKGIYQLLMEQGQTKNLASDERRKGRERRGNLLLDQNDDDHANENGPAKSALPASQPTTTKAGLKRQRMQWTTEMNEHVMRSYYHITKLDTQTTGYRTQLRQLFLQKFPEYANVTEQRLVDQKRVILTNNRLSKDRLEEIKSEIATELKNENQPPLITGETVAADNTPHMIHTQADIEQTPQPTNQNHTIDIHISEQEQVQQTTTPLEHNISTRLQHNILEWTHTNPRHRPTIPKLQFHKHTKQIIHITNHLMKEHINSCNNITEIHALIYCAAQTIIQINCETSTTRGNKRAENLNVKRKNSKPKWQLRIENRISHLRANIGRMTQYIQGNRSNKLISNIQHLIEDTEHIELTLDTLKQKLALYSARLRRYKTSHERKTQNRLFQNNEKAFYQKLNAATKFTIVPPKQEEITTFWSEVWAQPKSHNEHADWITQEENRHHNIPEQANYMVTVEELKATIQKTHNWKTPGIDHIHNFWYKRLTSVHERLTELINQNVRNPHIFPDFLTEGKTYIKPKNEQTQNPANYRPITCLPTLYKIITSIIANKIETHLTQNNILTEEQKGCRKHSQGCKEQLIIDSVILKQAEKEKRNLTTCYIDYKKAFDSVPHSWLQKVLEIYKIDPIIQNLLKYLMTQWRTRIHLQADNINIQTDSIQINRGIFQGDSLSALWFCLCLNPLSRTLTTTNYGFEVKSQKTKLHKINHLLYMDDIKLYAPSQTQMKSLIKITETISKDTCMEFGIQKCKMLHIWRGKWKNEESTETLNNEIIDNMAQEETYKYLGFRQNTKLDHKAIKTQLTKQYETRLKQILTSKLNSKNTYKAINTYAVPLLTYSFGVIRWTDTDLDGLNRLTRTTMTKYKNHHPKACTERLYLPRDLGGRGMIDIKAIHTKQITTLTQYFYSKTSSPMHNAIIKADKNYTPLNLHADLQTEYHNQHTELINAWRAKALHGKHINIVQDKDINTCMTYKWLKEGLIYPETEGFAIAIQDQVINTRNYKKYIIKDRTLTTDKCRKCNIHSETIDHITSGCKLLAAVDYTNRHNNVGKIIHMALIHKYNLADTTEPYYKYTPQPVIENATHKIYWDNPILTDKTITANRPDITLIDKINKTTYLIDIAVPSDHNVKSKYTEKIDKYTPLAQEIRRIWNQDKVIIIPLIISVTGITPQTLLRNLQLLNLPIYIHSQIQKAVILNTTTIVRKFLQ